MQSRGDSVMVNGLPQTTSAVSSPTSLFRVDDPVMINNGLSYQNAPDLTQDVSSLQYISAPDMHSSQRTNAMMNSTSQISNYNAQNDQAQWSAIDDYTNAPLRADAWSPWVMSNPDEGTEDSTVPMGDIQVVNEGVQGEEPSRNGI
ncbi:hypothetical protein PG993_008577 [Apiospora rasikravindrae]|uniref:Uncharacterized protein n=1 Tax=Apiospora rasikravindrae TaxID=990691 RepID=A0ABR1T0R1_9PEZI